MEKEKPTEFFWKLSHRRPERNWRLVWKYNVKTEYGWNWIRIM
jgi:hypothetical protein